MKGEPFDRIMGWLNDPFHIADMPIVSFSADHILIPMLIAVMIFILILTRKKKKLRSGEEHGSAKFADKYEILKFMDKDPRQNIILTETEGLSLKPYIDDPVNGRNKNILVIGSPGSWKTRSYVKPNIMQLHSSYVVTDPKGTVLDEVGYLLKKAGYVIKVFNLIEMDHSMHYNPFEYIRSEKDILKFADMIVEATRAPDEKADFWVKAEKLLYMALVGYIYYEAPEEEKTMTTLLRLLNASEVSENDEKAKNAVDKLFDDLEERYKKEHNTDECDHFAFVQYKKYKLAAGKSAKSILISCGVRLSPFDINEVRELMQNDDMELDMLGNRKTALFVITPDSDKSLNFIAAFIYMQMFNVLCKEADTHGGSLPVHVRCIFDEFRNIGKIPMFEILISTLRSRNISVTIIVQTKSQLKAVYKDDSETIIGCCDTTLFLGGQEKSALKDLSELLGTQTIEVANSSRSYGRQGSNSISYQKTGRKLMDESELLKLSGDKCILMIRGADPWLSKKYNISEHPFYKFLREANDKNVFDTKKYIEGYYIKQNTADSKIVSDDDVIEVCFDADNYEEYN